MCEVSPKRKISLVKNYCNKEILEQREKLKNIDYRFRRKSLSANRRYQPEPFLLRDFNEKQIDNINNYELRCCELDTIGNFDPKTVKRINKMPDDSFPPDLKLPGKELNMQC